ncbi:MAG: hypothetical protein PHT12_04670 [Patescibacteria group bacterium]|nr:hypothetical protein [Patescibacteria group bacterium]
MSADVFGLNKNTIVAAAVSCAAVFGVAALMRGGTASAIGWAAVIVAASAAAAILAFTIVFSVLFGAPYLPTDRRNLASMMELAAVKPGDRVADLGSGDGRILIAAAKLGATAEGWEVNPLIWAWSLWRVRRAGVGKSVRLHLGSYWGAPMSGFSVVTLFLIQSKMPRMARKLRQELAAGSRVVSYVFKFSEWEPAATNGHGVRLYVMPGDRK